MGMAFGLRGVVPKRNLEVWEGELYKANDHEDHGSNGFLKSWKGRNIALYPRLRTYATTISD
jgi:hypothetical protein